METKTSVKNSTKKDSTTGQTCLEDVGKVVEGPKDETDEEVEDIPEEVLMNVFDCPVCLQSCSFPVQLPCKHIFCFLCVKGVAHRSKKCAMCRQEIPVDFFRDPKLVRERDLHTSAAYAFDEGYQWFYEGRNGWWQYDERTSVELESRYKKNGGTKVFELLIAGFLYVIDLENMIQCRRNDQTRRRRIRRDMRNIPGIKGIAGLKYNESQTSRPSGDGGETSPSTSNPLPVPPLVDGVPATGDADGYLAPPAPNNTPQTPQTPADSPPSSVSNSDPDLSIHLQNLHLDENSPRSFTRGELFDPLVDGQYENSDSDDE